MADLAWIDGEITTLHEARILLEDRGFLLGDGVYEVIRLYSGRPFYIYAHLERLQKSAVAVRMEVPCSRGLVDFDDHGDNAGEGY